jgi:hypothetical protein
MARKPATPICKSFLLCRQIFQDESTGEYLLLGPTNQIVALQYPILADLSVFMHWTSAHGTYRLELQVLDLEGNIVWNNEFEDLYEATDPLKPTLIKLLHLDIPWPRPGKYDVVVLANDEEVVRDVFWAELGTQTTLSSEADELPPPD